MAPKTEFKKDDQGRYITHGLSEKHFAQVFRLIQKNQTKNRRNAKRTLTPGQLNRQKKAAVAKLGEKSPGVPFTVEDLKTFAKNRDNFKKKYDSKTDGITYAQLVSGSRDIDIKRANNQVDDGSGITRANLSAIKGNMILVRVLASMQSVHQEHMVKIRFEQWTDLLTDPPDNSYEKAVKAACKGRISIDCDCGRHQYWYRYLATMGRYAITPPAEFAFPKIRNPELKGVACKHVLKAAVMMQSPSWQRLIAKQMARQAHKVGFGDDRQLNHTLTESELKEAAKNRSTQIDKAKADKAAALDFKRYERAQKALEKKIRSDKRLAKKLETTLKRERKTRTENLSLKVKLQQSRDANKLMYSVMKDLYVTQGKTAHEALRDLAKKLDMTPEQLKAVIE